MQSFHSLGIPKLRLECVAQNVHDHFKQHPTSNIMGGNRLTSPENNPHIMKGGHL
jgi:hypothetical protein